MQIVSPSASCSPWQGIDSSSDGRQQLCHCPQRDKRCILSRFCSSLATTSEHLPAHGPPSLLKWLVPIRAVDWKCRQWSQDPRFIDLITASVHRSRRQTFIFLSVSLDHFSFISFFSLSILFEENNRR